MHSSPSRRPLARRFAAVALLGAVALAFTALPAAAADPAPDAAASAPAPPGSASYQPLCGQAKPGAYTCFALRRTDVKHAAAPQTAAAIPAGYGPADLQDAYGLPADGGAGRTIAIVDAYDDPTAEADLAVYRQQFGLPECTTANGCFSKVDQRGGTQYPAPDSGWAGEISLDLDMVSAVAPKAHILLVEADTPDDVPLGTAVDEAVALGAKYVSNSYGTDYRFGSGEDPSQATILDAYYNHPGVAIVASSGDYGYGVSYPAASPHVTSVGGTSLNRVTGTSRGWSESAWAKTGSGCSLYEAKPAFQTDTGCANRSVADVSAVADPTTGVAVYQSGAGWQVYGGTSASSPIIAGVYADAGTPVAGTYPNSYPYAAGTGLNDVTAGTNGSCAPAYLCSAGADYDGPTGLGTPSGLQAFRTGPHGQLTGTVTDRTGREPIAGATVSDGSDVARTDAQGRYSLVLPAGSQDLTVTAFGYVNATASHVIVAPGATVTQNFALTQVPSESVSGKVTDGSGHGWPLYTKVTVDGDPNAVWTDPVTGRYRLTLPQDSDFTLHFAAASPGYDEVTKAVHVAHSTVSLNIAATADPWKAETPGYHLQLTGTTETFDSTTSAPQGWSVVNADGLTNGWGFDDPGNHGNQTGGDGGFASVDSQLAGTTGHTDSELISPVYDLTGKTIPELAFNTMYELNPVRQTIQVEATDDGGTTWTNVWTPNVDAGYYTGPGEVDIPLTAYAGRPAVQLRFHYTSLWSWYWGIDNVFVGQRDYLPTPGGLVTGSVADANTGQGAVDATVTDTKDPSVQAKTVATPDDPALGDGFYSMFVPGAGHHTMTVAKPAYTSARHPVTVRTDSAVVADIKLKAGQLRVAPGSVEASVGVGGSTTRTLTVTNTGGADATLMVGEQSATASPSIVQGAPLQLIPGTYPLGRTTGKPPAASPPDGPQAIPSDGAWQKGPDLPGAVWDNVADEYGGKIYSGFGDVGLVFDPSGVYNTLSVLDPSAGTWTALAPAADAREAPVHGIIDGKLYVAGGWSPDGPADPKLEIYDVATNTWSTGVPDPAPYAGSGSAVLDGKLYEVGGCQNSSCGTGTTDVTAYDPATDTWNRVTPYPESTAWASCAGIAGKLYCAGGASNGGNIQHAYVYDPASGAWSALPDMPITLWGSAYAAANGLLVVSGGVTGTDSVLTNQSFAFDPQTGTWLTLPNVNTATYRGAGALGFYKLGGSLGGATTTTAVEHLPGYAVDPTTKVPWLTTSTQRLTLKPGQHATLTVALDADVPQITGPGTYQAQFVFGTTTPYTLPPATVTLTVTAPDPAATRTPGSTRS